MEETWLRPRIPNEGALPGSLLENNGKTTKFWKIKQNVSQKEVAVCKIETIV